MKEYFHFQKILLNDIFDKGVFVRDQREAILRLIRQIDAQFEPVYTPLKLNYSNKLLTALNSDQPTANYPKQPFILAELRNMAEEQLRVETSGILSTDDISISLNPSTAPFKALCQEKFQELQTNWRRDICLAFSKKLGSIKNKMEPTEENLYPSLSLFTPEQYADMILEYLKMFIQRSAGIQTDGLSLYERFGRLVYQRHKLQLKEADGVAEKIRQLYLEYCDAISSGKYLGNARQIWQTLELAQRNRGANFDKEYTQWSDFRCIRVGQFLFDILKDMVIDENLLDTERRKSQVYVPIVKTIPSKTSFRFEVHPVLLR